MTIVKTPADVESPPSSRTRPTISRPSGQESPTAASVNAAWAAEPITPSELAALMRHSVGDGAGQSGRHVKLMIGGNDEPSVEPFLYQMLGVIDSTELLFGVSPLHPGDLEYCRAEHGDPHYRVELAPDANSPGRWEIWRAPAAHLRGGTLAGASLVLPAHAPEWVILAEPTSGDLMLFPIGS